MDEELTPTGANAQAIEDAEFIRARLEKQKAASQGTAEVTEEQPPTDHLLVDGQDLRNHPEYDELRLDIPWSEEEANGQYPTEIYDRVGFHKRWQDRVKSFGQEVGPDGRVDPIDNPRAIWLRRKHALTKEGDAGLETVNAIKKGGLKLVSSVLTAPERYLDMATGEMQNVGGKMIDKRTGKPYKPDWDPLGNVKNPWTNSWWGTLAEMGTHYGVGGRWASKLPGVAGLPLTQKAIVAEGIVAALSENSQNDNITGQIAERVPWTREVFLGLASSDTDHPLVLTFKNVLEEMSLAKLFGMVASKFDQGEYALKKADDVDAQIKEKGELELKEELEFDNSQRIYESDRQLGGDVVDVEVIPPPKELPGGTTKEPSPYVQKQLAAGASKNKSAFRGHKNKPHAQPGQGSPSSRDNAFDIHRQMNRGDDWGNDIGSTGDVMTPVQAQRGAETSGFSTKFLKEKAKELLSDSRYKELIKEAKENRIPISQLFGPAMERVQEIMGRHSTAVSTEDFWKPILDMKPAQTGEGILSENLKYFSVEQTLVADLVNGALFKKLRDLNMAARELSDSTDVFARDGLMDSVRDRLTFGLANAKRARYLNSTEFAKFKGLNAVPLNKKAIAEINKRTVQLHTESKEAVDMLMDLLKKGETDELSEAVMEVFSMNNKIQNWMDIDKWMKQKIIGGEFKGKVETGVLVKELQGVFVNSILSGPKTPLRAIIGTAGNAYMNSLHSLIGATMRAPFTGDFRLLQASARNTYGMFEILPDSWKVFKANLNGNFGKKVDNIETRFSQKQRLSDQKMAAYEQWAFSDRGSWNHRLAFNIANNARWLNDNRFVTWSSRVLASTDETFKYIMAKARSKELAFSSVYDEVANGKFTEITPDILKKAEDMHYSRYIDEAGDLDISKDLYLQSKFKEATLTEDLTGFAKRLESNFAQTPWARPFFLFARTGVNGLRMNAKNTPIIGALMKESRDILMHSGDDFTELAAKYGIEGADDLARQKNLIIGRQAMGNTIVMMAASKYMEGGLTGSGPANRSQRKLWEDSTEWQRNTIELGGVRVGYDAFEPYNTILSTVANIGDNMQVMGPEWAQDNLGRLAFAITASVPDIINKSYMQGLTQLVDLFNATDRNFGRIAGNILNNQIPLASLRNEVGKILNPRMRELNKDLWDSIRNRNLSSELITGGPLPEALPLKHDLLNGEPLRDWNFIERMWNATSPVSLSLKQSPGRTLLMNSQYDMTMSVLSAPNNGPSLARENTVRSLFGKAIGEYRDEQGRSLETILDQLAEQPSIIASVEEMHNDMRKGDWNMDPMKSYNHNKVIKFHFDKARKKAWAKVVREGHPDVLRVLKEHKDQQVDTFRKRQKTRPTNTQQQVENILDLQRL